MATTNNREWLLGLEVILARPRAGASNKKGVGKINIFLSLSVNISKTVADTAKVTID